MRVVIADRPGPSEVLHTVTLPDPEPDVGQVRVVVEVAALTFVDTLIRAGSALVPPARFPVVLGNGVGGRIDRVGPEVDPTWVGRRVVTGTGGTGGYASLALANASDLHPVPAALDLRDAAALLADGRTAVGLHRAARIRPGETVAVTAAAGGVGGILVQLSRASGAHTIALAGSAHKLDHARSLGAGAAVNYRDDDWTTRLRAAAPDGIDVVFDGIGAETTSGLLRLVRSGGRYLQHGAAGGRWGTVDPAATAARNVAVIPLSAIGTTREDLFSLAERALDLAAHGSLRPTVGQTFPFDQAAAAHAAIESRATVGKTLLLP